MKLNKRDKVILSFTLGSSIIAIIFWVIVPFSPVILGCITFLLSTIWIWYRKFTYHDYSIMLRLGIDNSGHILLISLVGGESFDRIHLSVRKLNCLIAIDKLIDCLVKYGYSFNDDGVLYLNEAPLNTFSYINAFKLYINNKAIVFDIVNTNLAYILSDSALQPVSSKLSPKRKSVLFWR